MMKLLITLALAASSCAFQRTVTVWKNERHPERIYGNDRAECEDWAVMRWRPDPENPRSSMGHLVQACLADSGWSGEDVVLPEGARP